MKWGILHSFVKCFLQDLPANFYWNLFVFDQHRAKINMLTCFWDTILYLYRLAWIRPIGVDYYSRMLLRSWVIIIGRSRSVQQVERSDWSSQACMATTRHWVYCTGYSTSPLWLNAVESCVSPAAFNDLFVTHQRRCSTLWWAAHARNRINDTVPVLSLIHIWRCRRRG